MFRFTAEVSTLISLLAFGVSLWVNTRVFAAWGLQFSQVAAPSDVLMSGVALLGQVFWAVIGAIALAFGTSLLVNYDSDKLDNGVGLWRVARFLLVTLAVLLFMFPILIGLIWLSGRFDLATAPFFFLGAFTVSFAAAYFVGEWSAPQVNWENWIAWIAAFVTGSVGLLLAAGWFERQIADQGLRGFQREPVAVFRNASEHCPGGRLMWSGSQAAVIACPLRRAADDADDRRRIDVVRDTAGLVLTAVPARR